MSQSTIHRTCQGSAMMLFALASLVVSCKPPSLLITPVAHKQGLEETILMRDSLLPIDKIALIDVSGLITNTPSLQLFGARGEHPVSLLLEQLDRARRDRRVKAVILRINSPGGTVTASELMHNEIRYFKETSGKPVIAVMMDVAASGGYYIACACDEIVAQRSTITGSIGVIMQTLDVSGTLGMIGVKADAITSGIHKDSGSPLRAMRAEERALFQAIIDDSYQQFVRVVDAGRENLNEADVRRLADGRVYTASQALEAGLIDRIADLRETIGRIKERIGTKRIKLVTYHRPYDYHGTYYARSPATPATINLLNVNLASPFPSTTPQFLYLWQPGT